MIEVHELSKSYGRRVAVDRLSFTVQPGRITGFLGSNGAGKSTTLRMMVGLDKPDHGHVHFDELPYQQLRYPLRRVGVLLESPTTHGGRSAYHHLLWLAQSQDLPGARVDEVLELVGLTGVADRRAGGLSLGMAQRLGLAAALLGDPPVLLLDEPTNGLDPAGIRWLRGLLTGLAAQGRTVFLSSHLLAEMAQTADHLVMIGHGQLLAEASVPEFIASAPSLEDAFLRVLAASADR